MIGRPSPQDPAPPKSPGPRVADVDLLEVLGSARSTGQEGSPADEALLACVEQAQSEEHAACSGTA